jgi:uncharacterized protein YkwD
MRVMLLRRFAALLTGTGLALGMLGLAAAPAQAKSFRVGITASNRSVVVCEGVNLTGTVAPRPASRTVWVQERIVGQSTWRTVAKVSTTSAGNYRTTVVPTSAGDRHYRIYKPRAGSRKAGYSRAVPVSVVASTGGLKACPASSPLSGGGSTPVTGAGIGAVTTVTFTPQIDAGRLAAGFTSMPSIDADFVVVNADEIRVAVPAGLGGAATLAVTTPAGTATTTFVYKTTWRGPTAFESKLLGEINKRRASARTCHKDGANHRMRAVRALSWDGTLGDLARSHSNDLAARQDVYGGLSHTTYGTSSFTVRFAQAGVTGSFGEVLAVSSKASSASAVVDQWIKSVSGHCENLMNAGWTKAGVGVTPGVWQAQDSIFSNVDFR